MSRLPRRELGLISGELPPVNLCFAFPFGTAHLHNGNMGVEANSCRQSCACMHMHGDIAQSQTAFRLPSMCMVSVEVPAGSGCDRCYLMSCGLGMTVSICRPSATAIATARTARKSLPTGRDLKLHSYYCCPIIVDLHSYQCCPILVLSRDGFILYSHCMFP